MVDIFVDYPFTARMRFRVMYCVRVLLNLLNYSYTKATEQSSSVVLNLGFVDETFLGAVYYNV